jgi:hypothetical protein
MAHSSILRQPEFDALLAWLAPSRDQAGEKYEFIRQRLLRYFESHGCDPPDEHADETINRVARRVATGEEIVSRDPARYFYGVAKNVAHEHRKRRATQLRLPEFVTAADSTPSRELMCLRCCWWNCLSPLARRLLADYYCRPRLGLAMREGISPNALRLRVFKEKHKLRACVSRCLDHPEN